MTPRRTRVLLADDHTLVRAGVRKILEGHGGFEVVGEVASGEEALRALEAVAPEVLVLDLTMPGLDGFELLRRARSQSPELKLLVLSMHAEPAYVARAVREGAHGYLVKDSAVQELVAAIEEVVQGGAYFSPPAQRALLEMVKGEGPGRRALDLLTDRECQVLKLIAEGLSSKEVGARLEISTRTVEAHRANLMRKLDLRSVALLTQFAIREGLIRSP